MKSIANASAKTSRTEGRGATQKQIRGSSLLLSGRFLAVGLNFAAQVLIVRYLSTADYGAFAYALSIVAFCETFATLGLKRAITRFVPIYHEKEEYGKVFGTIIMVIGTILLTGLATIVTISLSPQPLDRMLINEQQPRLLLAILVFLVPVQALDGLLIGLFASFVSPRAIFFRKHVLGPGLKLVVVLLLVVWQSDVTFLAYGYLAASAFGVLLYSGVLLRLFRRVGLAGHFRLKTLQLPVREIFSFTIPVLTSDLLVIVMHSVDVLLLGYYHDSSEVAFFRVVLPAAHLNTIVMSSFALLFTPSAARLFAKNDYSGINHLYWRTAVWIAVLSFPVFVVTFSTAQALTVLLYGERYAQSGVILALLSLGYYFNAALGFNGLTLKVLGKLRYIVLINLLAVVVNIAINLLLIPRYGALGAAIGTASTMIAHNILKQAGLRLASGLSIFDRHYLPFYLLLAGSALGLFGLQRFVASSISVSLLLAGFVSLFVFMVSKKHLHVAETFPELLKLPVIRLMFR